MKTYISIFKQIQKIEMFSYAKLVGSTLTERLIYLKKKTVSIIVRIISLFCFSWMKLISIMLEIIIQFFFGYHGITFLFLLFLCIPKSLNAEISKSVAGSVYVKTNNELFHFNHQGLTCKMRAEPKSNQLIDYCKKGASIDIHLIVQVETVTNHEQKQLGVLAGRYVRIAARDNVGLGNGIHLSDELKEAHYWWQSAANRRTRIAPIANSYGVSLSVLQGKAQLVKKNPENENPSYNKEDADIFAIKGSIGVKEIGYSGFIPNSLFEQEYERKLIWHSDEYIVHNASSQNNFKVAWVRSITECDELLHTATGCYFVGPLWLEDYIFNPQKYSAMSHASFSPEFETIYRVPENYEGISEFQVTVYVDTMVRFGRVTPPGLFTIHAPNGEDHTLVKTQQSVIIDWSQLNSKRNQVRRIRSLAHNNKCLTVSDLSNNNGYYSIFLTECTNDISQMWLTGDNTFQSQLIPGQCLTGFLQQSEEVVMLADCGNENKKKQTWQLEDGLLYLNTSFNNPSNVSTALFYNGSNDGGISFLPVEVGKELLPLGFIWQIERAW